MAKARRADFFDIQWRSYVHYIPCEKSMVVSVGRGVVRTLFDGGNCLSVYSCMFTNKITSVQISNVAMRITIAELSKEGENAQG
jgi:hypothetical protein